nr:deoxyribodipyrimidine photo-lyase [uncultured Albidiferax sp.]
MSVVVWLKKDLRSADHAPLAAAAPLPGAALAVFVIEPEWLASPECHACGLGRCAGGDAGLAHAGTTGLQAPWPRATGRRRGSCTRHLAQLFPPARWRLPAVAVQPLDRRRGV